MLLLVGNVRAQVSCPTTGLPSGCSWGNSNGGFNVTIPSTTCTVQITYCYVCCSGTNYFYISSMTVLSGDCDDVDPQLMENAAAAYFYTGAILDGTCQPPPCPQTTQTIVMTPTCWEKNGASGEYTFSGCGTGSCYCQLSAQVCVTQLGNVINLSGCSSTTIGTCGSCSVDPGSSYMWTTGTCYQLSCPPPPC